MHCLKLIFFIYLILDLIYLVLIDFSRVSNCRVYGFSFCSLCFASCSFLSLLCLNHGGVLFRLLGALVFLGVALDQWGINRVEGGLLLVLVAITDVKLLENTVIVEAVWARPLKRANNDDTIAHWLFWGLTSVLSRVTHNVNAPARLLQVLGNLNLLVIANWWEEGCVRVCL